MRIALADDDAGIRTLVDRVVTDAGYELASYEDGVSLLESGECDAFDLFLLDVMMPRMDGFGVCQELRSRGFDAPLIFLSAKGDIVDKGIGFRAGGDDYLVKPFLPEELIMRIDALLRRELRLRRKREAEYLDLGDLKLDGVRHKAQVRGRNVELTPKEFLILFLLASNPGEVFTREQIIESVWGKEFIEESSSVAVFIRRLREKIEEDPSNPKYIQTVWRTGYRFGD